MEVHALFAVSLEANGPTVSFKLTLVQLNSVSIRWAFADNPSVVATSILCLKVLVDAAETKLSNSDFGINRLS